MKLHQKFCRKLIVIALIPYGLASFAATAAGIPSHLLPPADQPGKVESATIGGDIGIRISDPDGVNYYEIFQSGGKKIEANGNGNCEPSITVPLSGTQKHGHAHTVRFTDCSGGSERWEANSLTTRYKLGDGPYPYLFPQKQFAMRIVDMNLDTIPDIVVLNEGDQGLNVSVFVGNGDGSLEDPTFTEGRVMQLPNMDGFPNGDRF